jgi:hypothetical protein
VRGDGPDRWLVRVARAGTRGGGRGRGCTDRGELRRCAQVRVADARDCRRRPGGTRRRGDRLHGGRYSRGRTPGRRLGRHLPRRTAGGRAAVLRVCWLRAHRHPRRSGPRSSADHLPSDPFRARHHARGLRGRRRGRAGGARPRASRPKPQPRWQRPSGPPASLPLPRSCASGRPSRRSARSWR